MFLSGMVSAAPKLDTGWRNRARTRLRMCRSTPCVARLESCGRQFPGCSKLPFFFSCFSAITWRPASWPSFWSQMRRSASFRKAGRKPRSTLSNHGWRSSQPCNGTGVGRRFRRLRSWRVIWSSCRSAPSSRPTCASSMGRSWSISPCSRASPCLSRPGRARRPMQAL